MRQTARLLAAIVSGAVFVGLGTTGPASAEPDPSTPAGDEVAYTGDPSPYVQADSPGLADKILGALRSKDASRSSAAAATVQYGPCVLYPTVVYLRTSSDRKAVGFKPYTKCSVYVSKIRHESDLRYKWYTWWRQAGSTFTGGNYGAASYTQTNIAYYCKGTNSTTWAGTTLGTIVYGGKTYYARVYPTSATLACKA